MRAAIKKVVAAVAVTAAIAVAMAMSTSEASANTNSCAVIPFVPVSCPVNTLATGVQEGVAATQDNFGADFLAAVDTNPLDTLSCRGFALYSGGAVIATNTTVAAGVSAFPPGSIAGVYAEPPLQAYTTVFAQCL